MKKILAIITSLTILLCTLALPVFGADGTIVIQQAAVNTQTKVVTISGTNSLGANRDVTYRVLRPTGSVDYLNQNKTGDGGSFSISYTLGDDSPTGTYTVSVGGRGVTLAQTTFEYVSQNPAPTSISLTNNLIDENAPVGTVIGTLSAEDNIGDTHTFELLDTATYPDNASFSITGATLKTAAVFDYETKNSYSIGVRVTDTGSNSFNATLTINVNDVNEGTVLYGDVNGDKIADLVDAILVLRHDSGTLLSADKLTAADVNGDKTVDLVDAILILRYDSGIIKKFPVEQ